MKKLMMAAMIAASAIGAAEAAAYKWQAQMRYYPDGVGGWWETTDEGSGTVEADAVRRWIGVFYDGSVFGAVSATTYDALMEMPEMSGAYLAVDTQAEDGMIKYLEASKEANAPYSGECLLYVRVDYESGEYGAIPEPTSGALALLGVAFLMLKRREELEA